MKNSLKIVLVTYCIMIFVGALSTLSYNFDPELMDDQTLRIESLAFEIWFFFTLIFNITLFLMLSVVQVLFRLIKYLMSNMTLRTLN